MYFFVRKSHIFATIRQLTWQSKKPDLLSQPPKGLKCSTSNNQACRLLPHSTAKAAIHRKFRFVPPASPSTPCRNTDFISKAFVIWPRFRARYSQVDTRVKLRVTREALMRTGRFLIRTLKASKKCIFFKRIQNVYNSWVF